MTLRVRMLDSTVEIVGNASLLEALAGLVDVATEGEPADHQIEVGRTAVLLDGREQETTRDMPELDAVLMVLNTLALDETSSFAVHAGVVARAGRVAAFPADSGSGKSTLTAACLLAGLDYVSDEALCLDRDGKVRTYPKPLSLSTWSLAALGLAPPSGSRSERPVPAAELQSRQAAGCLRLSSIVLLRRRSGPARVAPLHRAEAAMLLLQHSFNHFRDPSAAFAIAIEAAQASHAVTLEYEHPQEAAQTIVRLLTEDRAD